MRIRRFGRVSSSDTNVGDGGFAFYPLVTLYVLLARFVNI
jgi:hypothetical protein